VHCYSKKGAFDKRDWFRQQMNRYKKETQENAHKVCQFASQFQYDFNSIFADDL
jgi:hypothetical protein